MTEPLTEVGRALVFMFSPRLGLPPKAFDAPLTMRTIEAYVPRIEAAAAAAERARLRELMNRLEWRSTKTTLEWQDGYHDAFYAVLALLDAKVPHG